MDGTGTAATFNAPSGVICDSSGNVYVSELTGHVIRKITTAGVVTTLAGLAATGGEVDGIGSAARFNGPFKVATDNTNLYVVDAYGYTIRKIVISTGNVTTLASSATVLTY